MAVLPEIDGYTDLAQVARGGFGVVYRARQERFDRVVAVKVLSVVDLTQRDRQRFDRECRAMGSLSWHPNVVAVYDSGITEDGHPFLVMEFLPAGSLADHLVEGPAPWPDTVRVGVQVAGALGAAHAAGTLHRDLKPENLLVGPFGEAKLGDFGIAAVEGVSATTTGHASLTVAHVAPEIMAGERPDERSDVYGLASTLHTLLTGAPPFAGERGEAVAALITRVLRAPAPRVPGVPDDLADLLQRALSKDPGARPQTAEEMGRALQAVQAANGLVVTDLRLSATAAGPDADADADADAGGDDALDPAGRGDATPTVVGFDTGPRTALPTEEPAAPPGSAAPPTIPVEAVTVPPPEPPSAPPPDPSPSSPTVTVGVVPAPTETPAAPAEAVPAEAEAATPAGPAPVAAATPTGAQPPAAPRQAEPAGVPGASGSTPRAAGSRRGVLLAVLLAAVVLVLVAIGVMLSSGGSGDDQAGGGGSSGSDAGGGTGEATAPAVTATVGLDPNPVGIAAVDDAVWITHTVDAGTVTRVDPATNEVVTTIPVGARPRGIAATDSAVWVANFDDGTVSRIDPSTNAVVATIAVGGAPRGVAALDDVVWVTDFEAGTLLRIDPATNQVVTTIAVGAEPVRVDATAEQVWVTNNADDTVTRVFPASNTVVATVEVGDGPVSATITDGAVWVTNAEGGTVSRIDPSTDQVVATIEVGDGVVFGAASSDALWVANMPEGTVTRITLADDTVTDTIPTGAGATGVAISGDAVWVTDTGADDVSRVEPANG